MYIVYTTRFGKVIRIPTDKFYTMSDEELEKLEESEGVSLYPEDSLYKPIKTKSTKDDDILPSKEE